MPAGNVRNAGGRGEAAWFWLLLVAVCFLLPPQVLGERLAARPATDRAGAKEEQARPQVRIPVEGLGYMAPGALPAFGFRALVELHFIDATHLLFSFDIPSLLPRDRQCSVSETQRKVRAVDLDIPSGKVEKQAEWELYDFGDYLWGLGGGKFLLRRCLQLDRMDASLDPHPLIEGFGAFLAVTFSPDHTMMMTDEDLPPPVPPKTSQAAAAPMPASKVEMEFIRLHPLGILAHAEIPIAGSIPIVAQGMLEALTAAHDHWIVNLQSFQGQQRPVVDLHSFCKPTLTPVSNSIFVSMMCPKFDQMDYEGYSVQGALLWRIPFTSDRFYPRFILSRNGAHFAIETLHLTHPHAALDPLSSEGVDGEIIDIYDTSTGMLVGTFRTALVYTAGKNADFSPDGTRLAVLNNGAIEIYTLNELERNLPGR